MHKAMRGEMRWSMALLLLLAILVEGAVGDQGEVTSESFVYSREFRAIMGEGRLHSKKKIMFNYK